MRINLILIIGIFIFKTSSSKVLGQSLICQNAKEVIIDSTYQFSFDITPVFRSTFLDGPKHGLALKIKGNGKLNALNLSDIFSTEYIVLEGKCDSLTKVENNQGAYFFQNDATYYVFVFKEISNFRKYNFSVNISPLKKGCEGVKAILCGEKITCKFERNQPNEVKFRFLGTGQIHKIKSNDLRSRFQVYRMSDCQVFPGADLIDNDEVNIYTEENKEYLINFTNTGIFVDSVSFEMTCEQQNNIICNQDPIGADTIIKVEGPIILYPLYDAAIAGLMLRLKDLNVKKSYHITQLSFEEPNLDFLNFKLFKRKISNPSCNLEYIAIDHEVVDALQFIPEPDYEYYLLAQSLFDNFKKLVSKIQIRSVDTISYNVNPKRALPLSCSQNIKYDFISSPENIKYGDRYTFQRWFALDSPTDVFALKVESQQLTYVNVGIWIEKENGMNLLHLDKFDLIEGNQMTIDLKGIKDFQRQSNKYFISIGKENFNESKFSLTCIKFEPLEFQCSSAPTLILDKEDIIINEVRDFYSPDPTKYRTDSTKLQYHYAWYKVQGDGEVHSFYFSGSIEVFENDCSNLKSIFTTKDGIYLEKNKLYLIYFKLDKIYTRINHRSNPRPQNYNCENAKNIVLNQSYEILPISEVLNNKECLPNYFMYTWYSYIGQDSTVVFEINDKSSFVGVFENDCSTQNCLISSSLYPIHFYGKKGITYYIVVGHGFSINSIKITHHPKVQTTCENSTRLAINQPINVDLTIKNNLKTINNEVYEELWYSINHSGGLAVINFPIEEGGLILGHYEIYSGCNTLLYSTLANNNIILNQVKQSLDSGLYIFRFLIGSTGKYNIMYSIDSLDRHSSLTDALKLSCQSEIIYDNERRINIQGIYNAMWLEMPRASKYYKVENSYSNNFIAILYRGKDTNSIMPIDTFKVIDLDVLGFSTSDTLRYFMLIGQNFSDFTRITQKIKFTCYNINSNDQCQKSLNLECGDQIRVDRFGMTSSFENCSEVESGNWYSHKWSSEFLAFMPKGNAAISKIYTANGNCNNLVCNGRSLVGSTFIIPKTSNANLIKITTENVNAEFEVACINIAQNTTCEKATVLSQGFNFNSVLPINQVEIEQNILYFKFEGNGELMNFDFQFFNSTVFQFKLFSGVGCLGSKLEKQFTFGRGNGYFLLETQKDVSYTIVINAYTNQEFEIVNFKFNTQKSHNNTLCKNSILANCGDTIYVNSYATVGDEFSYNQLGQNNFAKHHFKIPSNNFIDLVRLNNFERAFNITGYTSQCEGEINTNESYRIFENKNESIRLPTTTVEDNNYVEIFAPKTEPNPTKFILKCANSPENDLCNNPLKIECGQTYTADFLRANFNHSSPCNIDKQPDLWFSFLGVDKIIKLDDINSYIFNDSCESLKCIGSVKNNFITENINSIKDKPYLISAIGNETKDFKVVCIERAPNDACNGAKPLKVGSNTFSFSGFSPNYYSSDFLDKSQLSGIMVNGGWYKIQFETDLEFQIISKRSLDYVLYEGKCDSLTKIQNGNTNRTLFKVKANNVYYLLINTQSFIDWQDEIIISPFLDINDQCDSRIQLICDTIAFASNSLRPISISIFKSCFFNDRSGLFFEVKDTNFYEFTNNIDPNVHILAAKDCELECYSPYSPPRQSQGSLILQFNRKVNESKIVLLSGTDTVNTTVKCIQPIHKNINKRNALPLICGTQSFFRKNIPFSLDRDTTCKFEYTEDQALWYYFIGNGKQFDVKTGFSFSSLEIIVIDDNCNFINAPVLSNVPFITVLGKKYYLKIKPQFINDIEAFYQVEYDCTPVSNTELDSENLKVFPNPFFEYINISAPKFGLNYRFSNLTGNLLKTGKTKDYLEFVDLSDLAPGVYFIEVDAIYFKQNFKVIKY